MANTDYTTLADLQEDLAKILDDWSHKVKDGIAEGVQEAANIFIRYAEAGSPKGQEETGQKYCNSWAIKPMKHAKYRRYVGNTKKVKAHYTDAKPTIPLINILEFSTVRGHPHVARILESSKAEVFDCIIGKIRGA